MNELLGSSSKGAYMSRNLSELLDSYIVISPGMWENDLSEQPLLRDWWALANDDGIIAYFMNESDALRFRLAEINREMNG